jgi:ketosteroid isomerase-like protein
MQKSVWIVALALVGLVAMVERDSPVPGDLRQVDRDAIREHIDTIFQAYIQKDRETIQATHSKEWRGFLSASRSTIKGIDEYMEAAKRALGRPGGIVDYEMLEFDVLFYGDMAVVPYVAAMDVEIPGAKTPLKAKLRVLDIYAKQNGDWIQVASNTVRHPDTEADIRRLPAPVSPALRQRILAAREAVWRAWFTNDQPQLERVIPEETIAINAGEDAWGHREQILAGSSEFVANGGKLVSLEFPRTEIQLYGDVAILYTTYTMELETEGGTQSLSGRGTEIFIRRDGGWVNSGWHLDSGQ